MKTAALLALTLALASSTPVVDYGSGGSGGGSDGYGAKPDYGPQEKCTPYFDTQQKEHCESYTERVCHTTQQESCTDVNDQNCRGVVSSKQARKCFDVTELRCSLKEDVKIENIQVPVTIQKCHKAQERVCDTLYEADTSLKDKFQCITVNNPTCTSVERTIYDRTCRTTTSFDCDTSDYGSDYARAAAPAPSAGYGSGSDGYGNNDGGYSSTDSYGAPKPSCRRKQDTKCYKTPRTVSVQQCSSRPEKICEKMAENTPFVTPRQSCHNEEKRVCELIERSQAKQVKKYVYTKECRSVPRKVCENADQKALVPSCVPTTRKQCSYSPAEQCQDEPKQHCFAYNVKVKKQKCEKVYPEPQKYGADPAYPAPSQGY